MLDHWLQEGRWLFALAALGYAAGAVLGGWELWRGRRYARPVMLALVGAGFAAQTGGLVLRGLAAHSCPLGNVFEFLQFVGWSAVVLYLTVGTAFRVSLLGWFSAVLAGGLGLAALAVPAWDDGRTSLLARAGPLVESHVALAFFSYGALATLALTGVMLLWQDHSLRAKQAGGTGRFLPSVAQLEAINARLLALATAVLTVAIALGLPALQGKADAVGGAAKLASTSALWALCAGALALRASGWLIGRRLAGAAVALFVLALLTIAPISGYESPAEPAPTAPE